MVEENYDLIQGCGFKCKFVRQKWVFFLNYELFFNWFFVFGEKCGINRI